MPLNYLAYGFLILLYALFAWYGKAPVDGFLAVLGAGLAALGAHHLSTSAADRATNAANTAANTANPVPPPKTPAAPTAVTSDKP